LADSKAEELLAAQIPTEAQTPASNPSLDYNEDLPPILSSFERLQPGAQCYEASVKFGGKVPGKGAAKQLLSVSGGPAA
jgi:hypothetical protein